MTSRCVQAFQHLTLPVSGPENPWLVKAYAENVPHPFTAIYGQEIFESGIIPSDTDFRIYRDFGDVPGEQNLSFNFMKLSYCGFAQNL